MPETALGASAETSTLTEGKERTEGKEQGESPFPLGDAASGLRRLQAIHPNPAGDSERAYKQALAETTQEHLEHSAAEWAEAYLGEERFAPSLDRWLKGRCFLT